jgi:hypothetical protein
MSELDTRIVQWREQLLQNGSFYADEVEELESHLRESIDRLVAAGLSEDEAFLVATHRLGSRKELKMAYVRNRPLDELLPRPTSKTAAVALTLACLTIGWILLVSWAFLPALNEGGSALVSRLALPFSLISLLAVTGWGALLRRAMAQ